MLHYPDNTPNSWVLLTGNHGHEGEGTGYRYTAVDRCEVDHGPDLCPCMACLGRSHLESYNERLAGHPVCHLAGHPCDHHVDRLGDRSVEGLAVEHQSVRRQNVVHQRQEDQSEGHPYQRP